MDLTTANGTTWIVNNSNPATLDPKEMTVFYEALLYSEKIMTGFSVCGIYGNIVSVYIFWTNIRWQHPCNLYLFALAFADIGVIFWQGLIGGYLGNRVLKLMTSSEGSCKFIKYMWQVSVFTSSWLIVAYSVERFTAIMKPHWFRKVTSRHAKITIGLIVCLSFIFFIPLLTVYQLINVPGSKNKVCLYDLGEFWRVTLAFLFISVLNYALPVVLLVVMNIGIIWGLRKQNKMAARSMNSRNETRSKRITLNSRNKKRSKKITLNLVFISFFYLIVVIPSVALWAIGFLNSAIPMTLAPILTNIGLSGFDLWGLEKVFLSLSILNNCFNFVCYGMNLDFFREKFLQILTCGLFTNKRSRNLSLAPRNVGQRACSRDEGISALP